MHDPSIRVPPEPCEPALELVRPAEKCHYLPGTNPYLAELTEKFNIPLEALRGGTAGLHPEYRKQLRDKYVPPSRPLRPPRSPPVTEGLSRISTRAGAFGVAATRR